ncbi:hypothetical protein SAMN02745206_01055 [Desulfacinum infernum DSM 9756]|uniref:DUF6504 domain-containing protein n=1 Tax=Desulfacinum infernum DSM 9756 TaxID=1121391 RepID=A0A1M4XM47_9BACT|nr:DUF6504 family protein [Desulfacinum infernum]SHE94262.1 hypothetical protein SAMN02745206_01055 [Desulfacinum infernum DSM 9756]
MRFERIQVRTRDDYRGAQEPVAFVWRGETHAVDRVEDRWYEGSLNARRVPLRYFRVRTVAGRRFIVRYHELFDAWGVLVPPQEPSQG